MYADLPTWAKNLYTQTKGRAKKRGSEFSISKEAYAAMVSDRCALTGILFDTEPAAERHYKRPFAPSMDRIDCAEGYTETNVRIVCVCVNLAMNAWGEEVLFKMAAGLIAKDRDVSKWKRSAGKMPEGVKLEFVGLNGPRYSARARISKDEPRKYLGLHESVAAAEAAIAKAKGLVIPLELPTEANDSRNSLISLGKTGRRDWTRTNSRGQKPQ